MAALPEILGSPWDGDGLLAGALRTGWCGLGDMVD